VLQLACELRRRGHEVSIGCNRQPPAWRFSKKIFGEGHFLFFAKRKKVEKVGDFAREISKQDIPIIDTDLNKYFNIRDNWRSLRTLCSLLRNENCDIVHLHLPHDHWLGAIAKGSSNADVGLVATLHKTGKPHSDALHQYLYGRLIDRLVVVSDKTRKSVLGHKITHPRNVRTIMGAVNTDEYNLGISGKEIRSELGISDDAIVVGMVARFQTHRQHAMLVRVAPRILGKYPKTRFMMIGRGEYQPEIERQVARAGLKDKIVFAGYRREDYAQSLAALDILFFTVPGSDGTCRAVLQTMAVGKPVIAFDMGVLPETIQEGETGWIIPPGDDSALESALMSALSNPERLKEMGKAAHDAIQKRHTISRQAEIVEEYYSDLLEEKTFLANHALATT